jgi:hypothetical protein
LSKSVSETLTLDRQMVCEGGALSVGVRLSHYSAIRDRLMRGTVRQISTTHVYVAGYGDEMPAAMQTATVTIAP